MCVMAAVCVGDFRLWRWFLHKLQASNTYLVGDCYLLLCDLTVSTNGIVTIMKVFETFINYIIHQLQF